MYTSHVIGDNLHHPEYDTPEWRALQPWDILNAFLNADMDTYKQEMCARLMCLHLLEHELVKKKEDEKMERKK